MPNLQEVSAVAVLAEAGVARIAPAVAEKLALDLPEIFGGSAAKAARVLDQAPEDVSAIGKLAHDFQSHLGRYGLPKTATPQDLYEAAKDHGLPTTTLQSHVTRGHTAFTRELSLGDGNTLMQATASGRSLRSNLTAFLKKEQGVAIYHENMSFLGKLTQSWKLKSPAMTHEVILRSGS